MLRSALLAACLLLAFTAVHAQAVTDVALSVPGCSFNGHDFSSLAGTDLTGSDGGTKYAYYLSVCGVLSSSPTKGCSMVSSSSSACQVEVQSGTQSFDIGNWLPGSPAPVGPQWSYIDEYNKNKGIMYSMQGAVQCWASPPEAPYVANILFTCAEKQGSLTVMPIQGTCVQNYTLPTPLACGGGGGGGGDGSKGGLSGGWVFIIILCVVVPLYIAGGCLYKGQKLGATGMDKCPNVEFWRDLPALVKDGFAFTMAKIRGLFGGGGAGAGSNSYETM